MGEEGAAGQHTLNNYGEGRGRTDDDTVSEYLRRDGGRRCGDLCLPSDVRPGRPEVTGTWTGHQGPYHPEGQEARIGPSTTLSGWPSPTVTDTRGLAPHR